MYIFSAFIYIIIVYWQIWFSMGQLRCHQIQSNSNYLNFFVKVSDTYATESCNFNWRR